MMAIQFDLFIISNVPESNISYFEHLSDRLLLWSHFGFCSIETLMGLLIEIVNKVFIIGKSLFTITKWVKRAADAKIVNLSPFIIDKTKEIGRWVK